MLRLESCFLCVWMWMDLKKWVLKNKNKYTQKSVLSRKYETKDSQGQLADLWVKKISNKFYVQINITIFSPCHLWMLIFPTHYSCPQRIMLMLTFMQTAYACCLLRYHYVHFLIMQPRCDLFWCYHPTFTNN